MARVALENVSKVFPGGVVGVRNLDLLIEDREFLVLLGPSGCGKSTTLRLLAGLEDVTDGNVWIGDRKVNRVAPRDRNVAMVFQDYALYPHLSVYKNLAFALELRCDGSLLARAWRRLTRSAEAAVMAHRRRQIGPRVRQTAQVLGIEHLLDRMPRHLSGGERQRVALGRALVRQPAVFLFDEPLSNLDASRRIEMRRELRELHRRVRATMVYVTHDQVEAMTLGERIVVMRQGEIQQVGTPSEIYDRPRNRFVAGFVGSPPMNFLAGKCHRREGQLQFAGNGLSISLDASANAALRSAADRPQPLELGVRPEDLQLIPLTDAHSANRCGEGVVSAVEWLGDCAWTYVEIAAAQETGKNSLSDAPMLISKADVRRTTKVADRVAVSIDPRRIHVFDRRSGKNLVTAVG
jgi:multiple sugar transport system ATP-binding protein